MQFEPDNLIVLVVLFVSVILLVLEWISFDMVALSAVVILLLSGVLDARGALGGFSNEAVITVASMLVISAGLSRTGAVRAIGRAIFRKGASEAGVLIRIVGSVAAASAFINNTPIVAMMLPVASAGASERKRSISRYLIPISYAAMLGGMCTLIGTSTNLIVSGILSAHGHDGIGIFEMTIPGLIMLVIGGTYIIATARFIPERKGISDLTPEGLREYVTEVKVPGGSDLAGKTIGESGLRNLEGLFVFEIHRGDKIISPVGPEEVLEEEDRLLLAGVVSSVQELQRKKGLETVPDVKLGVDFTRGERLRLVEAVISPRSPLVGRTIKEVGFRRRYNAVVLAVHRQGERVNEKIGSVRLRVGDLLLIEAREKFVRTFRSDHDFFIISETAEEEENGEGQKGLIAAGILTLVVFSNALGLLGIAAASLMGAVLMVIAGCLTSEEAYASIDWRIIVLIAGMISLGTAMERSGTARLIADLVLVPLGVFGPLALLGGVYLVTVGLASIMTNAAAAALMVPIALVLAPEAGLDARPFAIAVAFGASAAFSTPIGYQTNILVFGPGGYRFRDFIRMGAPLNLVLFAAAMILIPVFWPLGG